MDQSRLLEDLRDAALLTNGDEVGTVAQLFEVLDDPCSRRAMPPERSTMQLASTVT